MIRKLLVCMAGLTLAMTSGGTAWAAGPESQTSDPRWTTVSRTVETVYAGVVGRSGTLVVVSDADSAGTMSLDLADVTRQIEATRQIGAAAASTCYWAQPDYKIYNGWGKLATESWYYIEWCSSGGKITSVPTFFCDGLGAQGWEYYTPCTKSKGATGFSTLRVLGTWKFRFGAAGVYTYRTHKVDATHNANGSYSGVWRMVQ